MMLMMCLRAEASEDIVAVVDLRFIEDTEEPSNYMCLEEDDCFVWGHYYLYDARVRSVINGELPESRFRVIWGGHSLPRRTIRRIVVMLDPLSGEHDDERAYRIRLLGGVGREHTMYCFRRADEGEDAEPDYIVESASGESMNCYERSTD